VGSTYVYAKSRNELESQQSFCTEIRKFYEGCFDEEGKYDGNGKLFIKRTYTFEGKFHAGEMDEGLIRLNGIPLYEGKVNAKGEINGKGKLVLSIPNNKNKKITLVDGNFHNNKLKTLQNILDTLLIGRKYDYYHYPSSLNKKKKE